MQPDQLIVLLDIEGNISEDDLMAALPSGRRHRTTIKATAHGAARIERIGGVRGPVDWDGLANATSRIAELVRAAKPSDRPLHVFVAGLAPLPMFFHLGFELSRWASDVTLLNSRDGVWEHFDPSSPPTGAPFFATTGLDGEPREMNGRVAALVTTAHAATSESIRSAITASGGSLAGIVTLKANAPGRLTAANCGDAVAGLASFGGTRAAYPHLDGLAVFLAVPAPLAFLAGRAINQTIIRDVWVMNFDNGAYRLAFSLPWRAAGAPRIDDSDDAEEGRAAARADAEAAIVDLRGSLVAADLVNPFVDADTMLLRLLEIEFDGATVTDEFSLSVATRKLSFGRGLLECMRPLAPEQRRDLARLLFLHEVVHFDQHVLSTNYDDIGRAGIALEEIDYWADGFALTAEIRLRLRIAGGAVADVATNVLTAHIEGLQVFDRAQHGPQIVNLPERRLRRYLIWYLQRERVRTARSVADVEQVLADRVVVELAQVDAILDWRGEKIVRVAHSNAELVVVVARRLRRFPKSNAFDPAVLIDAAKQFDGPALQHAMEYVAHQDPRLMFPWVK